MFGSDGKLYVTIGERQEQERAQNTMLHGGKVLRLNEDGTAPADNPFAGKQGYLPEIYSVGHRSPQGLVFNPATGARTRAKTICGPRPGAMHCAPWGIIPMPPFMRAPASGA